MTAQSNYTPIASPELPESDDESEIIDIREFRSLADIGRTANVEEAEERLRNAKREIAIMESGVEMDGPMGNLFRSALNGSEIWTANPEPSAEEVRNMARNWGLPVRGD